MRRLIVLSNKYEETLGITEIEACFAMRRIEIQRSQAEVSSRLSQGMLGFIGHFSGSSQHFQRRETKKRPNIAAMFPTEVSFGRASAC